MSICQNCGENEATQRWVGEGGVLGLIHGAYEHWCEVCVLTAQIDHAEERAALLPELRARLASATTTASQSSPKPSDGPAGRVDG